MKTSWFGRFTESSQRTPNASDAPEKVKLLSNVIVATEWLWWLVNHWLARIDSTPLPPSVQEEVGVETRWMCSKYKIGGSEARRAALFSGWIIGNLVLPIEHFAFGLLNTAYFGTNFWKITSLRSASRIPKMYNPPFFNFTVSKLCKKLN